MTDTPAALDPQLVQAFVGVAAMLAARPELRHAKGPHGIPLAAHAAPEVLELLQ